ncbi:MAG TPA: alkaline phosphatase family protein [Solirubrobacteraceae bacterium]|nr:alkaline phosphatase family protein [Solirubrobacteraceae bacterium]
MAAARTCEACGSPLAADQRYCLVCGTRAGGRSAQLDALIARVRDPGGDLPAPEGPLPPPPVTQPRRPRLPGPWVSALLVLAFVGFGALLGDAGSSPVRLAAAGGPLKLLVPGRGNGEKTGALTEASEPPPAEATETLAPAEGSEEASTGTTSGGEGEGEGGSSGGEEAAPKKGAAKSKTKQRTAKLADIKHVFVIVLADQPYAANFGPESKATYLARTLERKGELLLRYEAIAHEQLPNGIALLSGQGPTAETAANCPDYTALSPGTVGGSEQALGEGCVYPPAVQTLPGQLTARHLSWKAYVQGVDEGPGTPPACPHPALGQADATFAAGAYAGYRNPFVYFQSIVSSPSCAASDVGLDALAADLRSAATTPSFAYIVPDRCNDGGPSACAAGAPAEPSDSTGVLSKVVPEIMASKAYKQGGLIVITADEAPSAGEYGDSSSCCGQPAYPNFTSAGRQHGGGGVGALLLSPFVKGGTTVSETYNHYSLLRTIEDVFGLGHIGYAALAAVKSFDPSLLNEPLKG